MPSFGTLPNSQKLDLSGEDFAVRPRDFGVKSTPSVYDGAYPGDLRAFTAPLTNKGNPTTGRKDNTFYLEADKPIRVVNNATGEVVFEGVGYDAAQQAITAAQALTEAGGKKANWDIQTLSPRTGQFGTVAEENVNKSVLGTIADIGLPVLANALLPGSGLLSTMAGSALGSAASGALQGKSLGDIVKSAGISAATAGVLKGTPIGGALDKVVGSIPVVGDALKAVGNIGAGEVANAVGDEIIVTALPSLASSAIPGLVAPSLANTISNQYPAYEAPKTPSPLLEQPVAPTPVAPAPIPAEDLVVTAQQPLPPVYEVPPLASGIGGLLPQDVPGLAAAEAAQPVEQQQPTDEIVVTAQQTPATPVPDVGSLAGGALTSLPANVADIAATSGPTINDTVVEPKSDLAKIAEYLRLAGVGTSLLGGLLGGGGSAGTIPGGLGKGLSPTFSAKLPTANLPGASSNFAVRSPSEIGTASGQPRDWTRYGFGPEASFFSYVPQRGYAEGGDVEDGGRSTFAVRGPGDGRSDDIPAVLSDGEYVIDAETVALLGNGSSKAGAEALDRFRVNVRKHKGRSLAKGDFSVNAKQPEHYLAGGRT